MAGHLLQNKFLWAIHCLQPVKEELEAKMDLPTSPGGDSDSRSSESTTQGSIFDGHTATADSVSDFGAGAANVAWIPPPQGPTWQETMRELIELLE